MKKIFFYFHAGSTNHGCEAIVRSTCKLIKDRATLISNAYEDDLRYKIDEISELKGNTVVHYNFLEKCFCWFTARILKSDKYGYYLVSKYESNQFEKNSVALSIGGDNYCYGTAYNLHLAGLNKWLHKRKLKTVLWGCSIEPKTITEEMKRDFAAYDLIVARESISYDILKKINKNTILASDPAFSLSAEKLPLPVEFLDGKTVGINISPLIQKNESISGITLENYKELIRYILEETEYHIALIPHVVAEGNDDREPLMELYHEFSDSGKVCMIEDCNCEQLKGYISRCCLFIGARTHATIAAYSTSVPTLVIGYSTKATGIARDLFGNEKNYVLPVQQLKTPYDMKEHFKWLDSNRIEIKNHLDRILPDYIKTIEHAVKSLKRL